MTFQRPYNITLTHMAQWIDSNNASIDLESTKTIEYMYHLVFSHAHKAHLFNDPDVYDDFSLFCVSKLLTRYKSSSDAVKSVVNYIKSSLHFWYSEYVRFYCSGSAETELENFDIYDFGDYLIDASSEDDYNHFDVASLHLSDVVRKYLSTIPHKLNDPEWSNIYTSCLLTINDRLKSAGVLYTKSLANKQPHLLSRIIRSLKTKPPILFHLDSNLSCYVNILVNEIIHALSVEISSVICSKVTASTCLQNLVIAANSDEDK